MMAVVMATVVMILGVGGRDGSYENEEGDGRENECA